MSDAATGGVRWSIVMPYYNEKDFLGATLDSLGQQEFRDFKLILVDNNSTDGSGDIAREVMAKYPDIETIHLLQTVQGAVPAIEMGIDHVETEFLATCDADTYYPPHYMAVAARLLANAKPGIVAAMAMDLYGNPHSLANRRRMALRVLESKVFRKQAHTGGYGFCFRTDVFRKAGGYSLKLWPYVLNDHEVMQRVFKLGDAIYARDFWCQPSDRRSGKQWTLFERLLYFATPFHMKDWFFYDFLGPRFEERRQSILKLREREWEKDDKKG
ncbi:glycosyltransferase family 2 protein [Tsuneonella mangrovi]|uniref:glycosyltransferase family 2 protein n=1 Tax=Tsuneonella mangrovi TaxID=1982042 RepID=UPI000BA265C3|nr:glycosyltransferase family A protein [Tsuneonella mangrovi]